MAPAAIAALAALIFVFGLVHVARRRRFARERTRHAQEALSPDQLANINRFVS